MFILILTMEPPAKRRKYKASMNAPICHFVYMCRSADRSINKRHHVAVIVTELSLD